MTLFAIVACEIAFWVAIVAGLTSRYVLRRPRLGAVGDDARTAELRTTFPVLGVVLAVETLWAVSYTVWPRKPAAPSASPVAG